MEGLGHSGIRTLIVIPCLNEAKTIEGLLVKFTGAMQGRLFRIVVADGGSTDGTRDIVSAFAAADDRVTLLAN
ncbi:MAG: succinoglycan biosynthesis protein exoa, partial [Agrobacterium fabrum]